MSGQIQDQAKPFVRKEENNSVYSIFRLDFRWNVLMASSSIISGGSQEWRLEAQE